MISPGDRGIRATIHDPGIPRIKASAPFHRRATTSFAPATRSWPTEGYSLRVAHIHVNGIGFAYASIYNPTPLNAWTALPDMNAGRWYPTTTVLANGDVLVVSGSIDPTFGVNTLPQVFQVGSGTWRDLTSAQLGMDLYPLMFLAPNGKVFNAGPDEDDPLS